MSEKRDNLPKQKSTGRRTSAVGVWKTAMAEAIIPELKRRETPKRVAIRKELAPQPAAENLGTIVEVTAGVSRESSHDTPTKETPTVFRLAPTPLTDSMKVMREGKGVCMCRAIGTCPLMAYSHHAPCPFCTDPIIVRYYPTDEGWWQVRDTVKLFRKISMIEDEDSDKQHSPHDDAVQI